MAEFGYQVTRIALAAVDFRNVQARNLHQPAAKVHRDSLAVAYLAGGWAVGVGAWLHQLIQFWGIIMLACRSFLGFSSRDRTMPGNNSASPQISASPRFGDPCPV